MAQNEYAVRLEHVTKTFGPVVANKDVSLGVRRGEILALLGENGSGKTTLMNMIAGIYFPDEGEIYVGDKAATIRSPRDALDLGIGMIHQHFKLVDVFSATENIALSMGSGEKFDLKKVHDKARAICEKYEFALDLDQKVYEMSVSQKQTLEIVKVLYRGADILILDEPTAVLTPQETEKLFSVIRNMKADGKAVIIITHKLHEVLSISDRVAILRKGEYVGDIATKDADEAKLTEMMVGEKVELNIERPEPVNPVKRLDIEHLTVRSAEGITVLDDASFPVYGGEILGIAGISGNGQKELLEAIAGLQPAESGASIEYYAPDAAARGGHPPVLCARGSSGHGSGRLDGHDRQHDAEKLRQGPFAHRGPQGPAGAGRDDQKRAGRRHARPEHPGLPPVGRQRPEGAGGP